jgi:hypothetical protein
VPGIGFDIFAKDKGASAAFEKIAKNADATKDAMGRVAKANDEAAKASTNLRKTQAAEADALGKVRVAAAKLEDIRGNAKAKTGQLAAAEEALAAAQRKAADAADANANATKKAATAQDAAKSAAKQLADAQSSAFDKVAKKAKETSKKVGDAGEESGAKFVSGFSQRLPVLGGRISTFFKTSVGAAAGLAAGALAGAGFASAFNSALEQGSSKAKLQGQLGLTSAEAAKAGKIAGDLYTANYGESIGGVNDAIRSVIQNTNVGLNSIDLKPVTAKVLNLVSVFDQDLGAVTRGVGNLLRNGLAKDATEALNVVTKGFQSGVDKSEDFLDTLNEYGIQFRKLGLSGATATGLLSQGLRAGARDADTVADALKEFSIRAVDGSEATADGFKKLGLSSKAMSEQIIKGGKPAADGLQLVLDRLKAVKDPVKQSQIAVELFGTKAEDLGAALYALDPKSAVDALGQVAGAAGKLDQAVGTTPQARISSFFRTIKQGSIDSLGGLITAFATGSTEASGFQGAVERGAIAVRRGFDTLRGVGTELFNDAKTWGLSVIAGIKNGVDTGDWKPLGESVGNGIATGLQNISSGLGKITDALGGLIDRVDWGKLGRKTGDGISGALKAVDWKTLGSSVGDALIAAIVKAKDLGKKFGDAFKTFMDSVDWEKIGHDSTNAIGRFIVGIDWGQLGKVLGLAVLGSLKIGVDVKSIVINSAADIVTGMFKVILAKIEEGRLWVVGKTKELGLYLWSGLKSGVAAGAKGIGAWLKATVVDPVVNSVKSFFGVKSPSTVFAGIGTQLIAGLKGGIVAGARGVGGWVYRSVIVPVVSPFQRAGTWLVQQGKNAVAGFKNGIVAITGDIGRWIYGKVISPLVAPFTNRKNGAGTWLVSAGRNVIAGFKNGMVEIWGSVTTWVGGIATWIKNNKGPVSLDGRLLIPAGRAIMSGFLKGLKSGAGPAWNFVKSVGGKTVDALRSESFLPPEVAAGVLGGPNRRVFYQGEALDYGTYGKLAKAMKIVGGINVTQGSYERASSYSGSTHTGGGVFDVVGGNLSRILSGLKSSGLIGWIRNPSQGPWPWHIHALDPSETGRMSASARSQVADYYRGGNGLAGYAQGTPWVPNDQWARLHKGEAVLPAEVNAARLRASKSSGTQTVVLEFRSDGSPHMDYLIREFRKYVRVNGGDVQKVLSR